MKKGKIKESSIDNDFNLDDDLGVDPFGFDGPDVKDDRKPVSKFASGVFQGAKNKVKDTAFLTKTVKDILPPGIGSAMDLGGKVTDTAKSLYDESAAEIKPVLKEFKRLSTKLIPKESNVLPKSVLNLMQKWRDERDEDRGVGKEQIREGFLSAQLAEVFSAQMQAAQKDKAVALGEDRLQKGLELSRHRDIFGVLNQSQLHLSNLTNYQNNVTLQFQKKSLEVGYRSLFALQDLVEGSRKSFQLHTATLADIKKNTALPDYLKYQSTEMMSETMKRKFLANISGGLFGDKSEMLTKLLDGVKKNVVNQIKSFSSDFSMALSAADMGADAVEGKDGYTTSGQLVGEMATDSAGKWLGSQVKKRVIDQSPRIKEFGDKAARFVEDAPRKINEFRTDDKYQFETGMKSSFMQFLQTLIPNLTPDTGVGQDKGMLKGDEPFYVTKRADKSITEIIPGYLARIWREIQVLRTGNEKIELSVYDQLSGRITSKSKNIKSVYAKVVNQKNVKGTQEQLDKIITEIGATDLPPAIKDAIKSQILENSTSLKQANVKNLGQAGKYDRKEDQAAARHLKGYLESLTPEKAAQFAKMHNSLSENIADPRADMEKLVNTGDSSALKSLGLLDKDGHLDIAQLLKYHLQQDSKSTLVTSDWNMKEGFKNFDAKGALAAIMKMPVTAWNYKKGEGDGGTHIGPMAQDVNTSAGEAAAPGGKKVDLVTMNGITMAAIQELARTQETVKGFYQKAADGAMQNPWIKQGKDIMDKGIDYAKSMVTDVYVQGEPTPRMTAVKMKLGKYFDAMTSKVITDATEINGDVKDEIGTTVVAAQELPNLRVWHVENRRFGPIRFVGRIAMKIMKGIYNFYKDIAIPWTKFNFKVLKTVGQFGIDVAKMSMGFGRYSLKDVFVAGEEKPRMYAEKIRAGYYRSKVSGKIITHQDKIDGEVEDNNGNTVLSEDDLDHLQVYSNVFGKLNPFKLAAKIVKATGKAAMWAMKKGYSASTAILKALGKVSKAVGTKLFRAISKPVDVFVSGETEVKLSAVNFSSGRYYSAKTGKTIWLPREIDGPVFDRETQLQVLSEEDIQKGLIDITGKKVAPSILRAIGKGLAKLNRMFSTRGALKANLTKKTAADLIKDKAMSVSDKTITLLAEIRDSLSKKKVSGDTDGDGIREGSWQDQARKAKEAKANKPAKPGAPAAQKKEKKDDPGSGLIGAIGDLVGGLKSIFSGKGFNSLLKMGGLASMATGALPAAAGAAGAVGAAGTAMGALGTGALAVAGGLVSFLSSPIVLGVGAAALAGYGIYKGYKYLTDSGMTSLVKLRYVQYGFRANTDEHCKSILQMEKLLSQYVKVGTDGASIKDNDIDLKKLMGLFSVDSTDKDQMEQFFEWYQKRFKPVYLTHVTAVYSLSKKTDLGQIEDFNKTDKKSYMDAVRFPEGPYHIATMPSPLIKEVASSGSDVAGVFEEVYKELKLDKIKKKGKLAVEGEGTASDDQTTERTADGKPILEEKEVKNTDGTVSVSSKGTKPNVAGMVTALDAIRYKAYGLKELDPDKVKSILALEAEIVKTVKFTGANVATWDGSPTGLLNRLTGEFGIPTLMSPEARSWIYWLKNRFLPVFLAYLSAYMKFTGKKDISLGSGQIKPADQLEVSKLISGIASVWDVKESPWPEYSLNLDPSVIKDNLAYLASVVADLKLQEEKKKATPPAKPAPTPTETKAKEATTSPTQKPPAPADGEGESKATSSVVSTNMGSNSLKIASAAGELLDGRGGQAAVNVPGNVDITKVNPQFMKLFYGMAEEYHKLTGKKITINDAFRSYGEQKALHDKDPSKAAPPGNSFHEFGLALDVNSKTLDELDSLGLMRKYGLTRPVGSEPWHMEPAGIQANLDKYKREPGAANDVIKEGIRRGGGGYGTVKGANKYSRNREMAIAILKGDTKPTLNNQSKPLPSTGPTETAVASANAVAKQSMPATAQSAPRAIKAVTATAPVNTGETAPKVAAVAAAATPVSKNGMTASPSTKLPASLQSGDAKTTVAAAAKMVGVDPNLALSVVAVESDFKSGAAADTSTAKGLYQFTKTTWKETVDKHGSKYDITDSTNPTETAPGSLMGAHYLQDSMKRLGSKVNMEIGVTEAYLAHFLGVDGAATFLKTYQNNPDAIASRVMPQAASANRNIFFSKNNPRTVSEAYNYLQAKIQEKAAAHGITLPARADSPVRTAANDAGGAKAVKVLSVPSGVKTYPEGTVPAPNAVSTPVEPSPVNKAMTTMGRSPMNDSFGFNSKSTGNKEQAPTNNLISPDLMKGTEGILTESLTTQKQMLTVLQDIFGLIGKMPEQTKLATPNAKAPSEPYSMPKVPVPMRKTMV